MTDQVRSEKGALLIAPIVLSILLTCFAGFAAAESPTATKTIRHIDLVHMTHTDVGFTDHPVVCRRQQMRYLDIAIDAVLATRQSPPEGRFYWTAETTLAVNDWWQAANAERRADLLEAIGTGRLEIAAMAMNQTPTLNEAEWHTMLHWLPDELWEQAKPRVAIQNDVNGFPRAGAMALLDRGVECLFMGINSTNGGPPVKRPSAFWWKMPDSRRMFVWLGDAYPQGFYYFHPQSWRRGPVPESTDTRYRPARAGDFFHADEAAVPIAHAHLVSRLRRLVESGYTYPSLIVSVTNEWRMDNDPPFPPLADFVATWNRMGLEPELRMTTVANAMDRMRREVGDTLPEYEGEWTDWWANGVASGPREVAASRRAKRLVAAALSPIWGPPDERTRQRANTVYREKTIELSATDPVSVKVTLDKHGWPVSASWPGMEKPLFEAGTGDFLSVHVQGFTGRWSVMDVLETGDPAQRDERRRETLEEVSAVAKEPAEVLQNAHTTAYIQTLEHRRLKWFTRRLELWNCQPRARLTVRFHRTESERPEVFFVSFNLPCGKTFPKTSNGDLSFVPYEDQLPGTCRDYFSIDSWIHYQTPVGHWLWVTRDSPLVTFGAHHVLARRTTRSERPSRILAMAFNNVWFTNFVADSHGAFEFQFDMAWKSPNQPTAEPGVEAETMLSEPQVIINPEFREHPIFMNRLHRP